MLNVYEDSTTGVRECSSFTWTEEPDGSLTPDTDFESAWPLNMTQPEIDVVINQALRQVAARVTPPTSNQLTEIVQLPDGKSIVVGGYFRRDPEGNVVGVTCYPLMDETRSLMGQHL